MKQDQLNSSSAPTTDTTAARSNVVPFDADTEHRDAAPSAEEQAVGNRAAALLRALQRLESIVDDEVHALQQRKVVDFDQFSRRKNRGLLELVRSSNSAGEAKRDPTITAQIVRLRSKLEHNRNMLRLHFDAVRTVSEIISQAIRDADSDGTYPATAGRREER